MMNPKNRYQMWMLPLLALWLMLFMAACGAVAPAPTTEEEPAAAEETTTESDSSATEAEAATAEEEPGVIDEENALASEVYGMVVETDEPDVSAPRTNFGGEYRSVGTSDIINFHPYVNADAASSTMQGFIYTGGFINVDENTLEYEPYIAERYEISDDGLTFTFYLRDNIQWSDGEPLTAHDYEWTYQQAMAPESEFPHKSQYEFITSYKALDDYTIQATIDEIHAPALLNIGLFITPLPKHVWEDLPWDDPEANPEINNPSVVSGPYKVAEWERDQYMILEANENYWYHGAPNIERSIVEIVPDQDIAFQKLKTGEVDSSSMTPEQLEEARTLEGVTVHEWWPAQTVWTYLGMNMREGFVTSDLNVRRGIAHAIDKELLVDEVWLGQARRLCAIYAPTSWAHHPDIPCYEYDPDQALAEFAKSGYTLEGDKLVDEAGEQLTIQFYYGPNTSPTAELIAVTIQDYLRQVGINMEITALEWASFLEATDAEEPEWDMFLGGWRSGIEPHSAATIWAEENIPNLNSVAYINADMTAAFEAAGKTYDREARKAQYAIAQEIVGEDLPYITIAYRKRASAKTNRIQGLEPTALGIDWNREEWYIAE